MRCSTSSFSYKQGQKGVALLVALIALVAITLAGVALMRSVDTGLVIAGNLAFKQTTQQLGDAGIEAAIAWLAEDGHDLTHDIAAAGYYASWRAGCDFVGRTQDVQDDVVWDPNGTPTGNCGMRAVSVASDRLIDGYQVSYVINRMCEAEGSPNDVGVYCSAYQSQSGETRSTKSGGDYGYWGLSGIAQQYYRITARVVGPRNTSSIVQAIVTR